MKASLLQRLIEDIDSHIARDPAARSRLDVVLTYPGFHAVLTYRWANAMWRRGWRLPARWLSYMARIVTGIEIHPGATIGRRFFIDHGTGVVIGETSRIGDDVTIYHGVTLGGIAPSVNSRAQVDQKRHPTIEDGVIIGSGAQVLGPYTIGRCARVGANAVVHGDVPARVTAVGIPAKIVVPRDASKAEAFAAYATGPDDIPDPVLRTVEGLRGQVAALLGRVEELERELERRDVPMPPAVPVEPVDEARRKVVSLRD